MRLRTESILVLIVIFYASACFGQQIITLDDAKAAVHSFENNQSLEFWYAEYEEYECPLVEDECTQVSEWAIDLGSYTLCAGEPPDDDTWIVDAETGEVTYAFYGSVLAELANDCQGLFTQEECFQIAEDFASSKYAGFDTMGLQLRPMEPWCVGSWSFVWQQVLAYGVEGPNSVAVSVNPEVGAIVRYSSTRCATPVPSEPQVSFEQAVEIARMNAGIITLQVEEKRRLCIDPMDRTYWDLDVRGLDVNGEYVGYLVGIDVVTAEVISKLPLAVAPPRPPRIVSIRDLAAKVPGARVHWLGKDARLFVGKNRYALVPGEDTIEWTGGTIKLSQKLTLVNGRLMVPSALLDVLKGAPAPKKAPPTPAKSK